MHDAIEMKKLREFVDYATAELAAQPRSVRQLVKAAAVASAKLPQQGMERAAAIVFADRDPDATGDAKAARAAWDAIPRELQHLVGLVAIDYDKQRGDKAGEIFDAVLDAEVVPNYKPTETP